MNPESLNPVWGHVAGVVTVILMVIFIGIWVWAWLPRHRPTFDALARLPLEEDEPDRPSAKRVQQS